jgi:uncharacterized OB-fold protein
MTHPMPTATGQSVLRPAPRAYSFSEPFWEGTRDKRFLVQFCKRSGHYQFYPRPISIFSGRRDLEWREVSGRGVVFTYTIARRGPGPFRGHEPYLIATITLDVGVAIVSTVANCSLDDIRIGMKVKLHWSPLPDGRNLPMFQPDGDRT